MKKHFLFIIITLVAFTARAQYNYNNIGIGIGVSSVKGYTSFKNNYSEKAYNLSFIYNYTPYVPIAAEIQFGNLAGGGLTVDKDQYRRQYSNNYKALILHADLQAGEIIDYENSFLAHLLKGFYLGTGIGAISNSLTVQRTSLDDPNYIFPGDNTGVHIMIPGRVGYEFKIYNNYNQPFMGIVLGYNQSFIFGGIDGYNDSSKKFNKSSTSLYTEIALGVRLNFDNGNSYRKAVRGGYN